MKRPLLVIDFDGTLYGEDDPYWRCAQLIATELPETCQQEFSHAVFDHFAGQQHVVDGDNWSATFQLAERYGADRATVRAALAATQAEMVAGLCPITVSDAVRLFLQEVRPHAVLVLMSNTEGAVVNALVDNLGLRDAFHEIVTDAGKPSGLVSGVEHWGKTCGQVAMLGDNYRTDIEPARAAGWNTGHISRRRYFPGPATWQGQSLEDLLPPVRQWIEDAAFHRE